MTNFLKTDPQYNANLHTFRKKEGLSALTLFAIMCASYAALGWIDAGRNAAMKMAMGILLNAALSALTMLFLKRSKRDLSTVGLRSGRNRLSIALGGSLAVFYFCNNCLSHLLAGASLVPLREALLYTVYFFSVAVCEELVFRGYIGTRMFSLVKRKSTAVVLTGLLFVLMHFPYRMVAYGMTFRDFQPGWLIDLLITHTVFSLIYMKTNSLYGAILPHWVSNLTYQLIAR